MMRARVCKYMLQNLRHKDREVQIPPAAVVSEEELARMKLQPLPAEKGAQKKASANYPRTSCKQPWLDLFPPPRQSAGPDTFISHVRLRCGSKRL